MSRTLEEVFWTNGVIRSTNEQLAKALEEFADYDEKQREIILREAARRIRREEQA